MDKRRKRNLKNFLKMLTKYNWQHFVAMIFSILNSAFLLLQPIFLMKIIDEGVSAYDFSSLLKYILYFFVIVILQNISQYIMTYIYSYIGKKFIFELRVKILHHIENMTGDFYTNTDSSELFAIFDDDIDNIEQLASNMLFSIVSDVLVSIIMCIYLGWLQPELFVVILLVQPIMFFFQKRINKKSNFLSFDLRAILGDIIKEVQEYLSSIMQFIKLNAQSVFWKNYNVSGEEYFQKSVQLDMAYCKSSVLGSLLSGSIVCIIFGYGGYKVILGELTLGGLITFNQYSQKLFQPIISIAQNSTQLKRILVSLDKVFNLLEQETKVISLEPVYDQYIKDGEISFKNVSFHYVAGENIFQDLNLHLGVNSFNGIVGKSGQGKTTLINLLMRLWDIQRGEIDIDGVNIQNYNIDKLRNSITVVAQDVFLLNDTIKNNLTLYNTDISMSEIINITKEVGLYEFICNLTQGFETVVGDNGIKFSGGQKQRISIARVLLRNAPVVIFDEATAALDNNAQEDIIDLIFKLLKGRTVIIIAHRLKVIKKCDNIIVLEDGSVAEKGNHDSLMKKKGIYFMLYSKEE